MKNRGALIAVGVFAVLLVAVLATREKNVSVGIRKLELKAVDKDSVTGFEVSGGKTAVLKKDGDAWMVADPANPAARFMVDDYSIKTSVDSIPELAKGADFVTDKAEKHAELEIDDAKGIRVKVFAGGAAVYDLVFGKYGKGGGTYVRKAGDNAVFSTKARLGSLMKKDVSQWRKRQLLTVKGEDLKDVTVKTADGAAFTLESADGKEWKLKDGTVTPAGFRFYAQGAARLPQTMTGIRAQEFLDQVTPDQDAVLGLSGPHDEVTASTKDGKTISMSLGRELDSTLGATVSALKNNFDALDAAGTKDSRITLADLEAAALDAAKTPEVKKAIAHAQKVFPVLDTGAWALRAKDDGIGQEDLTAVEKFGALVPVRVAGDAQVYLVPGYTVQQMKKKVAEYRDLGLLAFDVEKARKLTVNAGKKVVAQKDGADWKIVEPKELPAGFEFEGAQVNTQLGMLKNLRAGRLVEPALPDAQAGLAKPSATVDILLEDGKTVTLRFGKDLTTEAGAKEVYVKGNADGALYAIPEYQRKRLETGVEIFRKPKPPPNMGGMGGMQGLDSLPPDIRKKLEAQMRAQQQPH